MKMLTMLITETTKEWAKREFKEILLGALDALREIILDGSFGIALIGGSICIIMYVAGWKDGLKWTGILFVANLLIQFLLGG